MRKTAIKFEEWLITLLMIFLLLFYWINFCSSDGYSYEYSAARDFMQTFAGDPVISLFIFLIFAIPLYLSNSFNFHCFRVCFHGIYTWKYSGFYLCRSCHKYGGAVNDSQKIWKKIFQHISCIHCGRFHYNGVYCKFIQ